MNPTIASLTIQYCDTCKRTVHLAYPAGNEACLSFHTNSVSKCINAISNIDIHQNYPLLTHQFVPFPTAPHYNNISTRFQPENLRLCQHPNHPLIHFTVHHKSHRLFLKKKIYSNSSQNLTTQ